jgi:hypothetical protein
MDHKLIAKIDIGRSYVLDTRGIRTVFPTVGSFFAVLLANLYTIIGIGLVFILIFGGINLIIGSKGDKGATAKGQGAITAAIAGFFITVFSYFIIQLIETLTGVKILNSGL